MRPGAFFSSRFRAILETMRFVVPALIACFLAPPAMAAPAPAQPPTDVSPVTVTPKTQPPKLAASFPAQGQTIAPGTLVLKVTFDQQMLKTGFDLTAAPGGPALDCLATPRLLVDNKTFVLLCRTEPGKTYALALNAKPAGGFQNTSENRALPTTLAFTTTAGEPVRNLADAMKASGLAPIDAPIEDGMGQ
jgi:hypothetical protein